MVGLHTADIAVIDIAFDILSVEALFLVPRSASQQLRAFSTKLTRWQDLLCSQLGAILWHTPPMSQRDGKLRPCRNIIKLADIRQTKDFVKFLGVIAILYLGTEVLVQVWCCC